MSYNGRSWVMSHLYEGCKDKLVPLYFSSNDFMIWLASPTYIYIYICIYNILQGRLSSPCTPTGTSKSSCNSLPALSFLLALDKGQVTSHMAILVIILTIDIILKYSDGQAFRSAAPHCSRPTCLLSQASLIVSVSVIKLPFVLLQSMP